MSNGVDGNVARLIRQLLGTVPGEAERTARAVGRRIARERGVPCLERPSAASYEMFARHGLACALPCEMPPFGQVVTGWHDDDGNLLAVGIPALRTASQRDRAWRRRAETILAAVEAAGA